MVNAAELVGRARRAWEKAGRPGAVGQLALFDGYRRPEVERARLQDRPRKRRTK